MMTTEKCCLTSLATVAAVEAAFPVTSGGGLKENSPPGVLDRLLDAAAATIFDVIELAHREISVEIWKKYPFLVEPRGRGWNG